MKLIIAGATGFVGKEVVQLSLKHPGVTSVIALSRKPLSLPQPPEDGTDQSKLRNVLLKDYGEFPENVKEEFAGADACIWTIAITPNRARAEGIASEEVKRVCQDCAITGLKAMLEAPPNRPFRFIYMSGFAAERDQAKTPSIMPEYSLMRGEAENLLLARAAESHGHLEVCVAKPGWITDTSAIVRLLKGFAYKTFFSVPNVSLDECSAAMLDQVMNGFEKEPLTNDDLVRIGRRVLQRPA